MIEYFKIFIDNNRKEYKLDKIDAENIYKKIFPHIKTEAKIMLLLCSYKKLTFNTVTVGQSVKFLVEKLTSTRWIGKYEYIMSEYIKKVYNDELSHIKIKEKKKCKILNPFTALIITGNKHIEIDMNKEVYKALELYRQDVETAIKKI